MEVLSHSPNQSPTMSPTMDHFNFNMLSPYLSAPSSPKRFGEAFYLSAPTSPSRFFSQFEDEDVGFAFSVNRESDSSPRSAEELFHGGKIKPLESATSPLLSPNRVKKSPISKGKKAIIEAFSPKNKKDSSLERRGRDRTPASEFSNSGRRVTRSHSPYRTSKYTWVEEQQRNHQQQQQQHSNNKEDSVEAVPVTNSSKSSRIWRLRDFLLFRSASEGRGTSKDPFIKYPVSYNKKLSEEGKVLSSIPPIPRSRRKENGVSAHELHYARKKAESEDLKKRTFLPYKQGILGRLAGLGSNTR
ncbi:uncharacterized protein LOC123915786 [Trifolium pratense]|uniref:uncharacterized protein LOC123915786 n=1 Tax=Trifolium pratense TaxID=57577 RepID=UPI001E6914D1|nr:uncharacterized protein LOC123915786 [Trifolium pratense]